jgi:hypothetical protein
MKDVIEGLIKKAIESFLTEDMINQAKDFLISELRKMALKTDNQIDDAIVAIIEKALK